MCDMEICRALWVYAYITLWSKEHLIMRSIYSYLGDIFDLVIGYIKCADLVWDLFFFIYKRFFLMIIFIFTYICIKKQHGFHSAFYFLFLVHVHM